MKKYKGKLKELSENILNKYVSISDNRATVDLYFDTFEELIDQNIGDNTVEKLNNTLIEKINDIFSIIPTKYEVFVNLHIKDFGEYTQEEAERIIKENISLIVYRHILERRRKTLTALSLLGGGIIMLIVSYFLSRLKWPQIIFDIINISGTLFVWEAANIGIIKQNAQAKLEKHYIKKFKGLQVLKN